MHKHIYTPESRLKHPKILFKEMFASLRASRELAWRLMLRDISARYRQSFLGIFWAFVPAVATTIALTFASRAKLINVGETALPYPVYVMLSMSLWQTFVDSLNGPIQGIIEGRAMLAKIHFPYEAIILSKLGETFFNFSIKLILLVGLFSWFQIAVTWRILLAPFALMQLVILGTFFGVLLAPFAALYRDISRGVLMLAGFWMLLTPVVYPPPEAVNIGLLVNLNPVTPLLVTTRELMTQGVISYPIQFWVVSGIAVSALFLSWVSYRLAMPFIIERMSA